MEKQRMLGSILENYYGLLRTHTKAEIKALQLSARDKGLENIRKNILTWSDIEANLVLGKPKKIKKTGGNQSCC